MEIEPSILKNIILVLCTLIFSAFFSGMEIAFISANKLKIEVERKKGFTPSALISHFLKKPALFITAMLIGNNIALVIYGIVSAELLEPLITLFITGDPVTIFIIQIIVSTLVILVLAEFLPKAFFRNNPNTTLSVFAIPVTFFYAIFMPIVQFTMFLSNGMMRLFLGVKLKNKKETISFGKIDLDHFIEDTQKRKQHEESDERNLRILANALDFSDIKIRECIVPRTELVAVNVTDEIDILRQKFSSSGNSKVLVYDGSIDNIIGYIHHSKLFDSPQPIRQMVKDVPFVPETMSAQKMLALFIKKNKSIAVVVDEFGGTAGIVTIEDIMEEIFGEIEDEHDNRAMLVDKRINETEFLFSSRIEIDFVNEKYQLDIPTAEEYETLSGLVLHEHGSIPRLNETISIDKYVFTIVEVSPSRIELVNLKINDDSN